MYSDLMLQYGHDEELPFVSLEKFFITDLKMSSENIPLLGLKFEGIEFTLSRIMDKNEKIKKVEELLVRHHKIIGLVHLRVKAKWESVYFYLENLWVYLNLVGAEEYDFSEKGIKKQLKIVVNKIKEGKANQGEFDILETLSKTAKQRFGDLYFFSNGDATNLLNLKSNLKKSENIDSSNSLETKDEGKVYQANDSNYTVIDDIMSNYVELGMVANSLKIEPKTLAAHMKTAGINKVKIGQKNQYLHKKEFEKFLDYFTINVKDEKE